MKLISMKEFVLEQKRPIPSVDLHEADFFYQECDVLEKIVRYANFLNQPLTLGMFVPCDEYGNVLEEKSIFNTTDEDYIFNSDAFDKYQQSKDKVLFENYTAIKIENYYLVIDSNGAGVWASWNKSKKIESLINEKTNVTLTSNAIKKLNL